MGTFGLSQVPSGGEGWRRKEVEMMRMTKRDAMASLLFLAIGIPYVGFLVNGEMPFVQDERGMSAVGVVLGAVAYWILRRGRDVVDRVGQAQDGVAAVSLALGLVSLAFAETTYAAVLLAVFMGALAVLWAFELVDHAGWIGHGRRPGSMAHG